ncbi:MAG: sigma-54-dependent Fis family transcriptional regulator [Spirochaetales bacterium]|nr:sigma-54-dependent Fis family transcriptional regulator [Spirochaetales bacterium]
METILYPELPILIVDDEEFVLDSIVLTLKTAGITNIIQCDDSRKVKHLLDTVEIETILLDLNLPYITGEEILNQVTDNFPQIKVIIVTGNNEIDTAVNCMKTGAIDYITKPFEKARLITSIKNCIRLNELSQENLNLKEKITGGKLQHPEIFESIITRSEKMIAIFHYIESIARSFQPVLITGETGTGKELVARAIHAASGRQGPFIAVNVAGIDDTVFADTLFGHKKGAYTSADASRTGLVKEASAGTLFLDEIGDLTNQSQLKLLRLLQENEYYPIGSDVPLRSDTRIIAATNTMLTKSSESGQFRKDLYFRLSCHHIHVPPLRDRLTDIPLLVDHFLNKSSGILNRATPAYPQELIQLLKSYHYPGNIRELEALMHDAVSRHESHILSLSSIRERLQEARGVASIESSEKNEDCLEIRSRHFPTLAEAEKFLIKQALDKASGNQSLASGLLGISRQTLNAKIKNLKLKQMN